MPRVGMEPIRRLALVDAAIAEIGQAGSLDVTVSQIARRAGVSSALAHHYMGSKDDLFAAAMRHILGLYGAGVRAELASAETPLARVQAIIRASFAPANFQPEIVAAWLNFYVQANTSKASRQLLHIYQRRLRSNFTHALRPLVGRDAPDLAEGLAAMIDGLYLRQALADRPLDPAQAVRILFAYLDSSLSKEPRA